MLQKLQTSFISLQQKHKDLEQDINSHQEQDINSHQEQDINSHQEQVNQLQEQLLMSEESSRNLDSEVSLTADRLILTNVLA